MSKKSTKPAAPMDGLPDLGALALPEIPDIPELPDLPDVDTLMSQSGTVMQGLIDDDVLGDNFEANDKIVTDVLVSEYAAIHEGRKKQQEAIELANDTEFWCAFYFQTREQKEAFLMALKLIEHGDKYIDGRFAAKKLGIELPPRPAPYKVGKIDRKLSDLT